MAALHLGATVLLLTLSWPFVVQALCFVIVAVHGVWVWRALQGQPRRLILHADGDATVEGPRWRGRFRVEQARAYPGAIQLTFTRQRGGPRVLLLIRDSLTPGDYHALCARIRQQTLPVRTKSIQI